VVVALVGLTPPASLAASQAAFTVMLLVLFALVEPTGVDVGLLRLGDVALGGAVSVLVALALWPHGAGGVLREAAGTALAESATYLHAMLTHVFGPATAGRPDSGAPVSPHRRRSASDPAAQRAAAVAAGYRFDDAFRAYRSESRRQKVSMSDVTHLVNAAAYLTLTADAIGHLWTSLPQPHYVGDTQEPLAPEAAEELLSQVATLATCYQHIGRTLAGPRGAALPEQQPQVMDLPRLAGEVLSFSPTGPSTPAGAQREAAQAATTQPTEAQQPEDHVVNLRTALAATRTAWTADLLHALWDVQAEVVRAGRSVGQADPVSRDGDEDGATHAGHWPTVVPHMRSATDGRAK
jgi:uncharacterized membrane protein YccC